MILNELFGWSSVLAGVGMGIYIGWKFQRQDWLGGYGSFARRMVRLAHIAAVAFGMLNIQYAASSARLQLAPILQRITSVALMAAAVLMPACCLWSAYGRRRHLEIFAAPVGCLCIGVGLLIGGGLVR